MGKLYTRHEVLGVDEGTLRRAVRELIRASDASSGAARFGISADDLADVSRGIAGAVPLSDRQRRTLEKIAAGPVARPPQPDGTSQTRNRRDVIAEGRTPVVYVTSSGRSGVWQAHQAGLSIVRTRPGGSSHDGQVRVAH